MVEKDQITKVAVPFFSRVWNWYNRIGCYFLNLEVLGFIIVLCLFIYFWRRQPKKEYEFQGLSENSKVAPFKKERKRTLSPHSKMEEACRQILEGIYFKPFPSARPNFLKNPATGKNLEFDCYNETLKIALEYDGAQHAKYNPYFHRGGIKEFTYQTKKDDYKSLVAKEKGITLIRIPHWVAGPGFTACRNTSSPLCSVAKGDLENYIKKKLRETGKL